MNWRRGRRAELLRTAIGLAVLFAFWGAIGSAYREELRQRTPPLAAAVADSPGQISSGRYFAVQNSSDARPDQIEAAMGRLERQFERAGAYLNRVEGRLIPITILNGTDSALVDERGLYLFFDGQTVRLNNALYFLILLDQQKPYSPATNLFIAGGFALYISEEVGEAETFGGQSADSWVLALRRSGQYLPLPQAWEIKPPQHEADRPRFARGSVAGASFMRWIAESYGLASAQSLLAGSRLEDVTGLFFDQAEADWLTALNRKSLTTKDCRAARPVDSILTPLCGP